METFYTLLIVLQVLVAIALIIFILIQHGKGADAGAAFGSGASSTVFGSQGSANFLTKATAVLATVFLGNSLLLAYLATQSAMEAPTSLLDDPTIVVEEQVIETDVPTDIQEQLDNSDSDLPDLPIE